MRFNIQSSKGNKTTFQSPSGKLSCIMNCVFTIFKLLFVGASGLTILEGRTDDSSVPGMFKFACNVICVFYEQAILQTGYLLSQSTINILYS